jgi:hypothetical protein
LKQPEYTRRKLQLAIDDARYLARRSGQNTWTVEIPGRAGVYENIQAESQPPSRRCQAGWSPDGKALTLETHEDEPRAKRRTYDVYDRRDPPIKIGEVRARSRSEANRIASETYNGPIIAAAAGPNAAEEVKSQLAREAKTRQETQTKEARRNARRMKEQERERLAERKREKETWPNLLHTLKKIDP